MGVCVRLPFVSQSLWYDEMYTLLHFVSQPWSAIVSGPYSPNNHILYSLLAKLSITLCGISEYTLRLPSVLAGALIGIAIAWPLRKERPLAALTLGLVITLNPWLITLSTEARGYTLLLLLSVLATNALPARPQVVAWKYALLAALAMYTIPIALFLIVAHGISMFALRRALVSTWLRSATAAALITLLLYSPFFDGITHYYLQPGKPSITYPQFLVDLPKLLLGWATPVAIVVILGAALIPGIKRALPINLLSFTIASALAILLPLALKTAGEPRFAVWLIPTFCLMAASVIAAPMVTKSPRLVFQISASIVTALLLSIPIVFLYSPPIPAMPMREAISLAKEHAGNAPILGLYLGAEEAAHIYPGLDATAYTLPDLTTFENNSQHRGYLVVFNEDLLRRKESALHAYIQAHYQLDDQLPGRVAPSRIYRPKP